MVPNCGQFVECTGNIVTVLCRVMWGGELWTVCGVYWGYRESFFRVMWGCKLWTVCGVHWGYRESFG